MTGPRISAEAEEMIIGFEVSSPAAYQSQYRAPTWPGGVSGVTIGVGYDLGYHAPDQFRADWGAVLPAATAARLAQVCGMRGATAHQAAGALRDIAIDYPIANQVFRTISLPAWTEDVLHALPGAATLPPACLGALVSLAYNRGCSFGMQDDRHREMRAIAAAIRDGTPHMIPDQIRRMKRLWRDDAGNALPGCAGLLSRRDHDADLFERGLIGATPDQAAPAQPAPVPVHAVGDIDQRSGNG